MAEEIQEAVQIIRVAYEGIDIAMRVGSGGVVAMQKALGLFKGMLDYEKTLGQTSMRKLLMKGGDLQVMQFDTNDMKEVKKLAKKYGVLYSVLPDVNKDGQTEIIFHAEATPRVNMMIQKIGNGRLVTIDDFLKDGDGKKLEKLMDFFNQQKMDNSKNKSVEGAAVNQALDGLIEKVGLYAMDKKEVSLDSIKENFSINKEQAENVIQKLETIGVLTDKDANGIHKVMMDKDSFLNRVRGYQELADRIRTISNSKNTSLSDITISKSLIAQENDRAVKTRVPGTWGNDARYVWLTKENIMDIHSGKTMLTFIDNEKIYKMYDSENRVVETKSGEELYSHYDKVESSVREKYEKTKETTVSKSKNGTKTTTRTTTTKKTR